MGDPVLAPRWGIGRSALPADRTDGRLARAVGPVLLLATGVTTTWVHVAFWQRGDAFDPAALGHGAEYSAALLGVLLAHETAHRAAAARHQLAVSMPWFLPFPLLFGTFGAIIQLRGRPRDRTALLEVAVAGPLGGAAALVGMVALRCIIGGPHGVPSLPAAHLGVPLGARAFAWATGSNLSIDPADPLAFGAWTASLVTFANLLPLGQLDGGHAVAAISPRYHPAASWIVTAGLLAAGLAWPGWAIWAALLHLLGSRRAVSCVHPEAPPRVAAVVAAVVALVVGVACAVPVPW